MEAGKAATPVKISKAKQQSLPADEETGPLTPKKFKKPIAASSASTEDDVPKVPKTVRKKLVYSIADLTTPELVAKHAVKSPTKKAVKSDDGESTLKSPTKKIKKARPSAKTAELAENEEAKPEGEKIKGKNPVRKIKKVVAATAATEEEEANAGDEEVGKAKSSVRKVKKARTQTIVDEQGDAEKLVDGEVKIKKIRTKTRTVEVTIETAEETEAEDAKLKDENTNASTPKKTLRRTRVKKAPEMEFKLEAPGPFEGTAGTDAGFRDNRVYEDSGYIEDTDKDGINDSKVVENLEGMELTDLSGQPLAVDDVYDYDVEPEGRACCCFPCIRVVPPIPEEQLEPWCCLIPCLRVKRDYKY